MRVLPLHVVPIFLGQGAGGSLGAQISYFDAFYSQPPVVGFQVIGSRPIEEIAGFMAVDSDNAQSGGVAGFCVSEEAKENAIIGFTIESPCEEEETVMGFTVQESEDQPGAIGFEAQEEEYLGGVVGFMIEETR